MSELVGIRVQIQEPGQRPSAPDEQWTYWEGGEVVSDPARPGRKYVTDIVLRGPLTSSRRALSRWVSDVGHGKLSRRTLTITELLSVDGGVKDGKSYVYRDCFPIGYEFPQFSATNSTQQTETLKVKVGRIEFKT
jgi:hypothetical protein